MGPECHFVLESQALCIKLKSTKDFRRRCAPGTVLGDRRMCGCRTKPCVAVSPAGSRAEIRPPAERGSSAETWAGSPGGGRHEPGLADRPRQELAGGNHLRSRGGKPGV